MPQPYLDPRFFLNRSFELEWKSIATLKIAERWNTFVLHICDDKTGKFSEKIIENFLSTTNQILYSFSTTLFRGLSIFK